MTTPPIRLTAHPDGYLVDENGRPFFYLADTIWMAFANLPLDGWAHYLDHRRMQGFDALQISILPVTHDTSMGPENLDPFLLDAKGNWDFHAYNEAYFAKAETMLEMATARGFVPVLGVLWCSYVPGTRCSASSPVPSAMPRDAVAPFAAFAAARFKRFNPIFFISGDTCFESPDEAPYYMAALQAVKAICPEALLSMHLHPAGELPQAFVEAVDFYMYQSGHGATTQQQPYTHAEKFTAYPIKRPVLNSEPPYEGHGRVGERTRFSAFDIRKATWQSLLSGAKMGITYGAHGLWSGHSRGRRFLNAERAFEPYAWEEALLLDGAWDVAFARYLFEAYDLFAANPAAIVRSGDPEARAAATSDLSTIAVYSPYAFPIELDCDLTGYRCRHFDLAARRVMVPAVQCGRPSRVEMPAVNADTLFLAVR